jgi:heptosyltransferase-2
VRIIDLAVRGTATVRIAPELGGAIAAFTSHDRPVLRRMPQVSEVIEAPFEHGRLQLRERWRLGRSLAARGYHQAIVLPNTWKAALVPFFADIPLRSGYVGESRYGLLNLLYRKKPGEPMRQ